MSVTEQAYAKVNLYLDVTGRGQDGYHGVRTVMHTLSLSDTLTVTLQVGQAPLVRLTMSGEGIADIPTDRRNLAVQAAELLLSRLPDGGGAVTLHLEKRIPSGAGYGGGSSDAAAVLRGINRLLDIPFSIGELQSMAAELGSDVPFFLTGGTASCTGRGEQIQPLPLSLSLFAVVAIGEERVSTPWAYRELDRLYSDFDGSIPTGGEAGYERFLSRLPGEQGMVEGLYNIFESAVLPACPQATYLRGRLGELGAVRAMLSGSGAGVFGLFSDGGTAAAAAEQLVREGYRAWAVHSV